MCPLGKENYIELAHELKGQDTAACPWSSQGLKQSLAGDWRNLAEWAVTLSCSKMLAALELPPTPGSQEPVSACPRHVLLHPLCLAQPSPFVN